MGDKRLRSSLKLSLVVGSRWTSELGNYKDLMPKLGFPGGSVVKNLPAKQETWAPSLGWEDALEKEIATPSSILA